eukprot:1925087-Rhodomonas_salina.3
MLGGILLLLKTRSVRSQGPANGAKALGLLHEGEWLYAVDGKTVLDLDADAVATLLRGEPSTHVRLSVASRPTEHLTTPDAR